MAHYTFYKDDQEIAKRTSLKSAENFAKNIDQSEETTWKIKIEIPSENKSEMVSLNMFWQFSQAAHILNTGNGPDKDRIDWLLDEFVTNIELERICVKFLKRVYHSKDKVYNERRYEYAKGDRDYS